jgi:pimeloyl-ACP methyl ester carboxylesterase
MTAPIQRIDANGVSFAYLEEGSGPLVLLVHGFPDTPQTWDAARPALAKAGYRAVTPWTRGYAPTAIPADGKYDVDTLGADILGLIAALGEKSAIVVGHDFGAAAAYSAVGLDPTKIRMLVTVAIPHPAALKPTPRLAWKVRHFLTLRRKNAAAKIRKRSLVHLDELVQRWSPTWEVPAGETDAVKASLGEPGSLEAALAYYRAFRPALPASQRKRIEVPSASFAGADDMIPLQVYERARSRYVGPHEVVTLPGGHFLHREHPDKFVPELLRVIASAPPA